MATIIVHVTIEEAPTEPSRQRECVRKTCQQLTDWIRENPEYFRFTLDVYDPEFKSHAQCRIRGLDTDYAREAIRMAISDAQRGR